MKNKTYGLDINIKSVSNLVVFTTSVMSLTDLWGSCEIFIPNKLCERAYTLSFNTWELGLIAERSNSSSGISVVTSNNWNTIDELPLSIKNEPGGTYSFSDAMYTLCKD